MSDDAEHCAACSAHDREQALIDDHSEMLDLLRELETKGDGGGCPCCGGLHYHHAGCRLSALLARFPR